jgi:hypothetical protein
MTGKCQQNCFSRKKNKTKVLAQENNVNTAPVKFIRLFRFASTNDAMLISASLMASILNGICLPLMVLLWGDLSNVIIANYDPGTNNTDITNTTTCPSHSNATQHVPIFTYILPIKHLNQSPIHNSIFFFVNCRLFTSDSRDIMDAVVLFAIGTTVIGLISVSLNFIFITCLNISAENQVSADSDYV